MNNFFGLTLKIWLKLDCWFRLWTLFGTHRNYIDNLSLSFGFGPRLWIGLARAEVCQYKLNQAKSFQIGFILCGGLGWHLFFLNLDQQKSNFASKCFIYTHLNYKKQIQIWMQILPWPLNKTQNSDHFTFDKFENVSICSRAKPWNFLV